MHHDRFGCSCPERAQTPGKARQHDQRHAAKKMSALAFAPRFNGGGSALHPRSARDGGCNFAGFNRR